MSDSQLRLGNLCETHTDAYSELMFKTRLKYFDGTLIYYGHSTFENYHNKIIKFEIPFKDTNYSFFCNVTLSKGAGGTTIPVNLIASDLKTNEAELVSIGSPSFVYMFIGRWK